jgi:Hypothetical protein (DUF2513)
MSMQRDMDLARQLLLHIESDDQYNGSGYGPVDPEELNKKQPSEIVLYHMKLLADAGFVDVVDWLADGRPMIRGLTWKGHEFLDTVRDPQIWDKTKRAAKKAGGSTLELLADIAKALIKAELRKIGLDF